MKHCPLPRPLSDGLVGLVLPRIIPGRHNGDVVELTTPFQAAVGLYDAPRRGENSLAPLHDEFRAKDEASNALLCLTGDRATLLRAGGKTPPIARMTLEDMSPIPDKVKQTHKRKRVDDNKSRRREQCRANQARYRDKQRNDQMHLEKSVEQLHHELGILKRRYRDLSSRERSNQSPWSIVAEVFRLLETSFRSPWCVTSTQEMESHMETRQIVAILARSFAHDSSMGELKGVDPLMAQVRLFSQYFGNPHVQLQRIESVAPGVMAARARLSLSVTELTLRHVFPHLEEPTVGDHGDDRGRMYQHLLGQRLECNCSLSFLFDEDSDRVVRLETSIDFTTPLLRVLGNLKDVSKMLEHARVSSECVIDGF